jgi:hypothetical protein
VQPTAITIGGTPAGFLTVLAGGVWYTISVAAPVEASSGNIAFTGSGITLAVNFYVFSVAGCSTGGKYDANLAANTIGFNTAPAGAMVGFTASAATPDTWTGMTKRNEYNSIIGIYVSCASDDNTAEYRPRTVSVDQVSVIAGASFSCAGLVPLIKA